MELSLFQAQVAKQRPQLRPGFRVLGIDPGETTGVCLFEGTNMRMLGQVATGLMPQAAVQLFDTIKQCAPDVIVAEDYRVYKWKSDSHAWAELHTPKLIGALQYFCHTEGCPLYLQSAQVGKGFCTDERLKEWGFYKPAMRHGNDALRHVCQWLMFGALK